MKKVITHTILKSVSRAITFLSVLLLLAASSFAQVNTPCSAKFVHYAATNKADSIHFYPTGGTTVGISSTYSWTFGDGSGSHDPFPWHRYTTSGKFYACLTIITANPNGGTCTDTWCDTILVPPPTATCSAQFQHYSINSNPDSVRFYHNLDTSKTTFTWTFGDGATSHNPYPWHLYTSSGKYYACLTIVTSANPGTACTNTWCDTIRITVPTKPVCNAHFLHYPRPTNPDSVYFFAGTGSAISSTAKYSWNFGDGHNGTGPTLWHFYPNHGKYTVCLTVTDSIAGGKCIDTWCDTIVVGANTVPCNANFTFRLDSVSSVYGARFFSKPNPAGTKFYWSFGDGTSSGDPNPTHSYAHSGAYWVCLDVFDTVPGGVTCTSHFCDSVRIKGLGNPVCNAHFQHYSLTNKADSVHFFSATGSPTTKYSWTFGDGGTSHDIYPWHFYANPGKYTVCLTVTDSTAGGKCTDTWCDTLHIGPPPPPCNAHYTTTRTSANTNTVYFAAPPNPAGTIYSWNFGDGIVSTNAGPNLAHTFPHDGVYWVCLTVVNTAIPCYETWCDSIRIKSLQKPLCNAHFVHYSLNNKADSVRFYVTTASVTGATYNWTFGDGHTSTDPAPWHLFAHPGNYTVCLTVTNSNPAGTCSDTWCDTIRIAGPPPPVCNAHFQHYSLQNADSVHFYSSTAASATTKYSWSFGDGSGSHDRYPWHFYANHGKYYVCLTVTDSSAGGKCSETWCDTIRIGPPPPPPCNAHFTRVSTNTTNTAVHFIPAANPTGTIYAWDFGDGHSSSVMDPTYNYANPGAYQVCLTVTSGNCTNTWCDSIRVGITRKPCDAHFNYQYGSTVNGVYFVHAPNSPNTKYSWDFGDGSMSHDANAMHQFANAGVYWVCLTVEDLSGSCRATWCDSIRIIGFHAQVCNSNFYFKPGNVPHSLYYFSSPNPPATKYFWDFGDGYSASLPNAFHQYLTAGTYKVCLSVTDTVAGCSDTRCLTIGPLRMINGGSTIEAQANNIITSVYPNPVTETAILHIENTNGAVTFRMYDNVGRLVKTMTNLTNGDFEMSKQGLGSGLYMFDVIDADNNATRGKLIIQ